MDNYFKQQICNQAANIAGLSNPENYLTGKTETAQVCRYFIELVIRDVLSRAEFDELKVRMPLTMVPNKIGYQLPNSYVSIHGVTRECSSCCTSCGISAIEKDPYVTFTIVDDMLQIHQPFDSFCGCNNYHKDLIYTTWDITHQQIPATLQMAMIYSLASKILSRNQGYEKSIMLQNQSDDFLAKAIKKQRKDYDFSSIGCHRPFFGTGRGRV
ncbi:MAG: hypothetical protein ACRCX2_01185 [Paraclostridium sp.]